ncbi:hypothetical protein [Bryocella elongata]|uniref:hypothetical protein n=1 Tax=Bryocella elongata TaxID=863522 RepID=UPI0011B018F5|nr:hypothetical protein [Bryocella elongata]
MSILVAGGPMARAASSPDEPLLDAPALALLEQRADEAKPQEQCFLYTEVLHGLTEAAGRAMAAGDEAQVAETMGRIDRVMHKIDGASAGNARRLKNAEKLMEHTERRLSDMARAATSNEQAAVQATLTQLGKLHATMLRLVFSK